MGRGGEGGKGGGVGAAEGGDGARGSQRTEDVGSGAGEAEREGRRRGREGAKKEKEQEPEGSGEEGMGGTRRGALFLAAWATGAGQAAPLPRPFTAKRRVRARPKRAHGKGKESVGWQEGDLWNEGEG